MRQASFNLPAQEEELVSESDLGRELLKLPLIPMPHHPGHLTHLTPGPEGDECSHPSEGWPLLLRPCWGRVTELGSCPPQGGVPSSAQKGLQIHVKLAHTVLVRRYPGPSTMRRPTHTCSHILKCGAYR